MIALELQRNNGKPEIGIDGKFEKKDGKESFKVKDSKMVDITDIQTENQEE